MHDTTPLSRLAVLDVQGLTCGYGRTEIIHGVDLRVHQGEIVCLIGNNGAGKSTLIKAVIGAIPTLKGQVRLRGEDLARQDMAARIGRGIAVVPEGRGVLAQLSVADNLLMGGYVRRGAPWLDEEMARIYALFPILAERRHQAAGTLSGGEQQMLVIGRALMSRPDLLILDEPSFGLAPKIVESIFAVIEGLRDAGNTVLLVEQNARIALRVADRGYVLASGRTILDGPAERLSEDTTVRDIYLGSG
nr:ABC transporter ATP-binding protein [Aquabacter cavernae]